ncbi:hypothetical protein EDD18DRAFT_1110570 [Armillaria luteobubalina]|uniref:Uncharacterized protein n=1 Tax=Armillaria luteobubalina TaxID=153913 RepID=A0AA39PR84_9AGAR|nr:hypothetical protein EDD18DRAFT_1110570 [Armillaria luteobubalina]
MPPVEATPSTNGLFYTTPLVPGYWKTIHESFDPTEYTIFQDIVDTSHASGTLYSVMFKFSYSAEYSASDHPLLSDPHFGFPSDDLIINHLRADSLTEMMGYGKHKSHVYDLHTSFNDNV